MQYNCTKHGQPKLFGWDSKLLRLVLSLMQCNMQLSKIVHVPHIASQGGGKTGFLCPEMLGLYRSVAENIGREA